MELPLKAEYASCTDHLIIVEIREEIMIHIHITFQYSFIENQTVIKHFEKQEDYGFLYHCVTIVIYTYKFGGYFKYFIVSVCSRL